MHWENAKLIIEFYFGPAFYYGGFLLIPALCFGSRNRSILFLLTFYYCCTRSHTGHHSPLHCPCDGPDLPGCDGDLA